MAKIIRFKSADQREWNQNQSMVINENGTIVRPVTPKEQMTMFQVSKHVAQTSKPFSTKTADEESVVEARLTKLPGTTKSRIDFFIDGFGVRGGRELIKERLLAEHGPCQVYGVNGKFLTMVRDPNAVAKARTAQGVAQASGVPAPDQCICKNWALSNGAPHPGKHHPVCQFNDKAPVEERGTFNDVGGPLPVVTAGVQLPAPPPPPPPAEPSVPSPGECHCKGWALPNGSPKPVDQHHPICEFKDKWEAANPTGEKYFIVNLSTLQAMREATPEEVKQAEEDEAKSGVMMVTIDGEVYGVMLESDIKAAS
jgi:hypothetical protein